MSIVIFILILAVLVLVHEFGHFIVAKKSGIRVDEFGLGFPPKIYSKKWGDTLYTLNAIPFGGFVKIFGEDDHIQDISPQDRSTSFVYKPKLIKASVLAAGVFFNILFAWLLISIGFSIGLPTPADHTGFGKVTNIQTTITEVLPGSPAGVAGLKSGDVIRGVSTSGVSLTGDKITPDNVVEVITTSHGNPVDITYQRGDSEPKTLNITPKEDVVEGKIALGIAMDSIGTLKLSPPLAILEGARTTYLLTVGTADGLLNFFKDALTFHSDLSQISGPIGIAGVVGEAEHLGFVYLLSLIALISINLAVINLFPFPALDGGRLFFLLLEAIFRRPIPAKFTYYANLIGFSLLIMLMVVVTGHDIFKLL